MGSIRTLAIAAATATTLCGPLLAQDLPQPDGEVILSIDGAIERTNDGDTARFDRAMLEGLDPVTITTTTIWTEGEQTFTGVALGRLMEEVGAQGTSVEAIAINDYSLPIPQEDWAQGRAVVAYLRNGAPMSIRDKGPLWVVYPYDDDPDLQSEDVYARSVWQLERMTVNP